MHRKYQSHKYRDREINNKSDKKYSVEEGCIYNIRTNQMKVNNADIKRDTDKGMRRYLEKLEIETEG